MNPPVKRETHPILTSRSTFALIKAPSVARGHVVGILQDITLEYGFHIVLLQQRAMDLPTISKFYRDHVGKSYYPAIIRSVSGMTVGLVLRHETETDGVAHFRAILGATNARDADPRSLRGHWGGHHFDNDAPIADNAVHASDSSEAALREFSIFFS